VEEVSIGGIGVLEMGKRRKKRGISRLKVKK
jgi:hypothetical protein